MFRGEKLRELRLLYGMSRAELADKLNITEYEIWQFESDKVTPKVSSVVFSLAKLFKVNVGFFDTDSLTSCVNREKISFRAEDLSSEKVMKSQEIYVEMMHNFICRLESYLSPPKKIIYSLVEEVEDILVQEPINKGVINKVSQLARECLGVSNANDDLLFKLELSGINVLSRFKTGGKIGEAYSLWTDDNVPYLVMANGKAFATRNFDLARELGNLLLHRAVEFEMLDKFEREKVEQEANDFALSFLLPDREFKRVFETLVAGGVSQPDSYISLKKHFNTSLKILEYKAFKLDYLDMKQHSNFLRQIHKKGYRAIEPLDREISVYTAGKILSMLDIVSKNNIIDIQGLITSMRISKEMLAKLLYVDMDYFNNYKSSVNKYPQIIKLNTSKD